MPWGIYKVKLIGFAVFARKIQSYTLSFNGDATFALNVHGIQHLLLHFTIRQTATHLDKAISNSGFAMIDMGDNGKVADQGVDGHAMTSELPLPINQE